MVVAHAGPLALQFFFSKDSTLARTARSLPYRLLIGMKIDAAGPDARGAIADLPVRDLRSEGGVMESITPVWRSCKTHKFHKKVLDVEKQRVTLCES